MLSYLGRHLFSRRQKETGVLLLHPFPFTAEYWSGTIEAVSQSGFTVIAPNIFGVGGSSAQNGYRFTEYCYALNTVLEEVNLEKVVCIGLSMGGYIAFEFLRQFPEKVSGIVAANTRINADSEEGKATRDKTREAVLNLGVEAIIKQNSPSLIGETTKVTQPRLINTVKSMMSASSSEAIAAELDALKNRVDATEAIHTFTKPILVIAGDEDVITPVSVVQEIYNTTKSTQKHWALIKHSGHLTSLERPEEFNTTLLQFLETHYT